MKSFPVVLFLTLVGLTGCTNHQDEALALTEAFLQNVQEDNIEAALNKVHSRAPTDPAALRHRILAATDSIGSISDYEVVFTKFSGGDDPIVAELYTIIYQLQGAKGKTKVRFSVTKIDDDALKILAFAFKPDFPLLEEDQD